MTPLAANLANQLTLPLKKRNPFWKVNSGLLRECLFDIHCFEVTSSLGMMTELAKVMESKIDNGPEYMSDFIGSLAFLPAPKTWIEYLNPLAEERIGLLLEEHASKTIARVTMFWKDAASGLGKLSLTSDDFESAGGTMIIPQKFAVQCEARGWSDMTTQQALLSSAHIFLMMINAPKIIGRRQRMPNVGLERRLLKSMGKGKFPLHAWTEIILEVNKPTEIDDGEPHEAHLTGRRALHFCRKYIRIRLGRLEYVSAHWRGDPALGIKQSRYKVVDAQQTDEEIAA